MPNTMNRQQDAQAAIEALERRRLQNRVAQKNRRAGETEEKRQRQQDGESQVSNKTSENPSSFEQNISTLPTFEPHISQSEVIQYEPWQQESFVSAVSDAYVDGIGACDNIETPIPNYMQDIQLESLQYSSSTPISSTKRRSLTAAFEPTKDPEAPREVNIQAQGSRIELAQQHASRAVPTRMISAPPTPSPTQISGACWLDNRGKTALHISAERGNIRIVRMLLHYGVDVNGTDSWGRSALHYASRGAHIDVVAHLLTVGADPEARDYEGRSPLHAAAEAESEAVIQLLAEEGADLNAAIGISSSSSIGEEGEDIPPIVET